MATQAQVTANQANSQKSTGPKTEEGKAISSRNRLSHGFASSTRFVKGEDPAEFNSLLDDLISEHQPATPTEQILVEQMAHHHWISLRATRLQDSIVASYFLTGLTPVQLGLFIRYQTSAERSFHKAHTELLIWSDSVNPPKFEGLVFRASSPACGLNWPVLLLGRQG